MERQISLEELLQGQDLNAAKAAEKLQDGTWDESDVLSKLLWSIWEKNDKGRDLDGMQSDFNYTINQLGQAQRQLDAYVHKTKDLKY